MTFSLPKTAGRWAAVRPGEGKENQKSDARARRQQSTVPAEALHHHADLQAHRHYRRSGVDHDEPDKCAPRPSPPATRQRRIFAHHGAPRNDGAALLTCGFVVVDRLRGSCLLSVSGRDIPRLPVANRTWIARPSLVWEAGNGRSAEVADRPIMLVRVTIGHRSGSTMGHPKPQTWEERALRDLGRAALLRPLDTRGYLSVGGSPATDHGPPALVLSTTCSSHTGVVHTHVGIGPMDELAGRRLRVADGRSAAARTGAEGLTASATALLSSPYAALGATSER